MFVLEYDAQIHPLKENFETELLREYEKEKKDNAYR